MGSDSLWVCVSVGRKMRELDKRRRNPSTSICYLFEGYRCFDSITTIDSSDYIEEIMFGFLTQFGKPTIPTVLIFKRTALSRALN